MNKGFFINYVNSEGEKIAYTINKDALIDYEIIADNISISFGKDCIIKRQETFYKWEIILNVMQITNFKELIEFLKETVTERKNFIK